MTCITEQGQSCDIVSRVSLPNKVGHRPTNSCSSAHPIDDRTAGRNVCSAHTSFCIFLFECQLRSSVLHLVLAAPVVPVTPVSLLGTKHGHHARRFACAGTTNALCIQHWPSRLHYGASASSCPVDQVQSTVLKGMQHLSPHTEPQMKLPDEAPMHTTQLGTALCNSAHCHVLVPNRYEANCILLPLRCCLWLKSPLQSLECTWRVSCLCSHASMIFSLMKILSSESAISFRSHLEISDLRILY